MLQHLILIIVSLIYSNCNVIRLQGMDRIPQRLQNRMDAEYPIIPNRLLNPIFNESISHILMNPLEIPHPGHRKSELHALKNILENRPKEEHELWNLHELVKVCRDPEEFSNLPFLFPRFLCGLSAVYREYNMTSLSFTSTIFPRVSEAIRAMNQMENYPCHSMNMTDVVALVPGRIYSGCVDDTNAEDFSQFTSAFVMTHPFPDAWKNCTLHPYPELRSLIVQHKILYQQEDACCEHDTCALLIFSQTTSLTPLVIKTIDLSTETMVVRTTGSPIGTLPPWIFWNL